jgi:hypothetical protein
MWGQNFKDKTLSMLGNVSRLLHHSVAPAKVDPYGIESHDFLDTSPNFRPCEGVDSENLIVDAIENH